MSTLSFEGLRRVTHSFPSSLPAGFWSKAYIITSEEVDEVVKVTPKRSVKAIPDNRPCFLVIVTLENIVSFAIKIIT